MRAWLPILVVVLLAQAALAATPLTQDRRVYALHSEAYLFPPFVDTEEEAVAPEFGSWDESVSVAGAQASQISGIDSSVPASLGLAAQGAVDVDPPIAVGYWVDNEADAEYTVTFEVLEDSVYALEGSFVRVIYDGGTVDVGTRLSGPGGVLEEWLLSGLTSLPVSSSGNLAPGVYSFEIWARVAATDVWGINNGPFYPEVSVDYDVMLQIDTENPAVVPSLPFWAFVLGVVALLVTTVVLGRRGWLGPRASRSADDDGSVGP